MMADTAAATETETDGAQRWYDAVTTLALLADLTRRVEALEQAWQRQHDAAQASGESEG